MNVVNIGMHAILRKLEFLGVSTFISCLDVCSQSHMIRIEIMLFFVVVKRLMILE